MKNNYRLPIISLCLCGVLTYPALLRAQPLPGQQKLNLDLQALNIMPRLQADSSCTVQVVVKNNGPDGLSRQQLSSIKLELKRDGRSLGTMALSDIDKTGKLSQKPPQSAFGEWLLSGRAIALSKEHQFELQIDPSRQFRDLNVGNNTKSRMVECRAPFQVPNTGGSGTTIFDSQDSQ